MKDGCEGEREKETEQTSDAGDAYMSKLIASAHKDTLHLASVHMFQMHISKQSTNLK